MSLWSLPNLSVTVNKPKLVTKSTIFDFYLISLISKMKLIINAKVKDVSDLKHATKTSQKFQQVVFQQVVSQYCRRKISQNVPKY